MKAVNLIPVDARRGAGGPSRSGGAVYGLLGLLGLLVILAAAYAVSGKAVKQREAELAVVRTQADAAEGKAGALAPYTTFAALRANRVQTVRSLAATRFDWSHALREVARTIPANAWLTSLNGTIAPGSSAGGGGGGAGSGLRSALPVPAFEVVGCTTSHRSVSRMMSRLRLIDGVQRVTFASSEKAAGAPAAAGAADSAAGGGDCRNGSDNFPKFELVVFFQPKVAPSAATAPPTAVATTTTSTTTTTPGATPLAAPAATSGSTK